MKLAPTRFSGEIRRLLDTGRTLEALDLAARARDLAADPADAMGDIAAAAAPAIASFNAHLAAGELELAGAYAARLARLLPSNVEMLTAAVECERAIGRWNEVAAHARALVQVDPASLAAHSALAEICKVTGDAGGEIESRMALALSAANPLHPLARLRDLHDAASLILCHPLTERSEAQLETLLATVRALRIEADPGSEWEAWETHYRLLLDGVDLVAVRARTPARAADPEVELVSAAGAPVGWADVAAAAGRLGARAVFFAAADEAYVDLYARWYARSVLRFSDVPCLVMIHVIGGAGRLAQIAARAGVDDARLVFAGDTFDAGAITTACHDAPPKGRSAKPLAHLQSVRFQRLPALMDALGLPVFVSDIDLLLQRGVADLLDRHAGEDLVLNENEANRHAGSRLTANLLLVNPRPNAKRFAAFLAAYLDDALAKPEVSRWIDQLGLLMARHHLERQGDAPRLGYFDTAGDINNVMYLAYQPHPFRFLSLYHGFDMASLEGVLG